MNMTQLKKEIAPSTKYELTHRQFYLYDDLNMAMETTFP